MELYYTKRSPYARKVRAVVMEKNIELDLKEEDLNRKSGDLLTLNPVGRIPVLVLDNGRCLTDSTLICEYLESLGGPPKLLPEGEDARLDVRQMDMVAKGMTDVTVSVFYERMRHPADYHRAFLEAQEAAIFRCLEYFERRHRALSELTLASIAAACAIGYVEFRVPHLWPCPEFPELADWYEGILRRPSLALTVPVP